MPVFTSEKRHAMTSPEDFERRRGRQSTILDAVELPSDLVSDLEGIAARHKVANADLGPMGGLLGKKKAGRAASRTA